MLALEASGRNPLDVRSGGENPVAYLRSQAGRLRSVGDLERTVLALAGAGLDPRRFAGTDLVAELRSRRDGDGSVDGQVNLTAFYALAMRAAGADPRSLRRPARWLRRAQGPDGGWGIQPDAPSEADSTGAALQGLVAAGSRGAATARGADWLREAQRGGGGWALGSSGIVNSQSTAWAVQGLVAAGGARAGDRPRDRLPGAPPGRRRPLPLLVLQRPDADLGHRAGPARGRAPRVPDPRGRAGILGVGAEPAPGGGRRHGDERRVSTGRLGCRAARRRGSDRRRIGRGSGPRR